jgi:GNAT superfamily N-acetyltransferase
MNIRIANTDLEITACYPVMWELRPHIKEDQFLTRVRSQEISGYRLTALQCPEGIVTVAGFRMGDNLAWGRFLYVDDLVILPEYRSKGYGTRMLSWLGEFAAREGCTHMHLDSDVQRKDAHRFYEREGMLATAIHFAEDIIVSKRQ